MALMDTYETRRALRDGYREELGSLLDGAKQTLNDDDLDVGNVPVVTIADVQRILADVFTRPVPPSPDTHAEVSTPAKLTIHATCPSCDIATPILLAVEPELRIDAQGHRAIHLKAKAKARVHVCGQQPLAEGSSNGAVAKGQIGAFEATLDGADEPSEEVLIEEGEVTAEADDCPFPGCSLKAEHDGEHDGSNDGTVAAEADGDLLPGGPDVTPAIEAAERDQPTPIRRSRKR